MDEMYAHHIWNVHVRHIVPKGQLGSFAVPGIESAIVTASMMAIRAVDGFLVPSSSVRPDDVLCISFDPPVSLPGIGIGIGQDARRKIHKGIAHLTTIDLDKPGIEYGYFECLERLFPDLYAFCDYVIARFQEVEEVVDHAAGTKLTASVSHLEMRKMRSCAGDSCI